MLTHKRRFILSCFLLLLLVTSFGFFSRYPDLNHKAMVAENHSVADTISMWPIFKVHATDPIWKKIGYTTINWTNDNKKGMGFGLVLAALLSCWLSYWQFNPGGRLRSAFFGMLLGSPLGVCVNCAAPVFKGALRSKRIEMALALMFASPTLNVVVLTMTFALLPLYMAWTKLLFNIAVILIGVPVLASLLKAAPIKDLEGLEQRLRSAPPLMPCEESIGAAFLGLAQDFWQQFKNLFLRTAPLMLLAGLLGATLSHLLPLEALRGQGSLLTLLLATTIGLILPVPMAFDVVLTHALFSAGLPQNSAMVLLLSLGVYSFYSFLITWQSASRRWALSIATGLWTVILLIGLLTPWLHENFYLQPNIASYQQLTELNAQLPLSRPPSFAAKNLEKSLELRRDPSLQKAKLTLTRIPFRSKQGNSGRFVQHEGPKLGLDRGFMYTIRDYPDPFWIGRGTAAGDFDQDGWYDLALGSDHGPLLYHNRGGTFEAVDLNLSTLQNMRVFAVAFVDLDSDSWPDLFISTFHQGNFWLQNLGGHFSQNAQPIPNGNGVLTVSPAFADLNRDGRIDIFNGNMALGIATGFRHYGVGRQNGITWNETHGFNFEAFSDEVDGETMASLISDFNGDSFLDLYVNNDFIVPDYLYFGASDGRLHRLKAPGISQFSSPFFSMAVDSGDVNNDLRMDLLITGTIAAKQDLGQQKIDGLAAAEYKQAKDSVAYCDRIQDKDYRKNCVMNRQSNHVVPFHRLKNLTVRDCQKLADREAQDSCLLSMMWMIVTNNDQESDCQSRYGFDTKILEVCQLMRAAGAIHKSAEFGQEAKQTDQAVLYLGQADGGLNRVPKSKFDHPGGWTWSSRLVDLDNDGWLDIFNAEGAVARNEFGWNVYLHNDKGSFVQQQFSAGLTNDFNLFSFVTIDYDHDGDLDIIGNGSEGPPQIYENQLSSAHHSVAFSIKSPKGNTAHLNAKVIIHPKEGLAQIREIKASGGYQSFDAPVVYFGLGDVTEIESLEIRWPGGAKQIIEGPLTADALYHIEVNTP